MTDRVATLIQKNNPTDELFLLILNMARGTFTVNEKMELEIEHFTKEEEKDLREWVRENNKMYRQ
jgi:hypothetical protein